MTSQLVQVKAVIAAGFEQDRGTDVKKNSNHHCHDGVYVGCNI